MLPEIGASELLVIAIVALVVVGPKDLPMLLRKLGQFTAKMRGMANEFRASFDEMARQSELDELRKEVEAMRRGQFDQLGDIRNDPVLQDVTNELSRGVEPAASVAPAPFEPEPAPAPKPKRKPAAPKAATAKAAAGKAPAKKTAAKPRARKPAAE